MLNYAPQLIDGFLTTVLITAGASIVMISTSGLLGISAASRSRWLTAPVRVIVEFFRGTSCYVQLFWAYFALPFFGIYLNSSTVGILVIGLNLGCYGSEVVRGAIAAVPRDQIEGAIALNLTRFQTMVHVILPQAMVTMIPPMGNLVIELLKVTSLVSLITIADLTFAAQVIRQQTGDTPAIYALLLLIYFLLSTGIAGLVSAADRHFVRGRDSVEKSEA